VEVAVTAQDGTTIIVYTIEVIRGLSNVITNFNDTKKTFDYAAHIDNTYK
jgi:hypothetical protein